MGQNLVVGCHCIADVKDCIQKVQTLKYGEEVCYNGTLNIKAFSSGLEIGSCNWTINGPKRNIAYISSSIFVSGTAMGFDYHALQGSEIVIYSDVSSLNVTDDVEDENSCSSLVVCNFSSTSNRLDNWEVIAESLLNTDESLEEMEKLDFICSCTIASVKAGGSVLIPMGRIGIVLQLLEQISISLDSSDLRVPIYIISSVAEELMAYLNIIPEWLCKDRQEKLYSGLQLFSHVELIKESRLQLFPAIHSLELLTSWQEPCIVFCPHWSLRLGPAVHLLRRWCSDQNSLLIMEEAVDTDLTLLPFKPMAMKVLQCSLLSGIKPKKIQPLLEILQPKIVLFPENSLQHVHPFNNSSSFMHFSENETLRIPSLKARSELDIETDLASQLGWVNLNQENLNITRLKGDLFMEFGKQRLHPENPNCHRSTTTITPSHPASLKSKPLLHWGTIDVESLVLALQRKGINPSVEQGIGDDGSEKNSVLHIFEPNKALIEVKETHTVISTADEKLASVISEAICSILNGI